MALHGRVVALLFLFAAATAFADSRSFVVTTTADDGGGSLRAAIDAANASCTGNDLCAVVFDITEPSPHPWKTIRVVSPLPALRAPLLDIAGATQGALTGVHNPDGPSIEISGGGTVDGDGLAAGGCNQTIANLAINGFRRFGIFSGPQSCAGGFSSFSGNFIGVDPTGSAAVPNLRGIVTLGKQSVSIGFNVISGNVRSGIFALEGNLRIFANRIGLAAHADAPLPNGASGIYIAPLGPREFAYIDRNVIAFNREFGIAIDRDVEWAGGSENRIWGNGGLAIDDGLDGPSPSVRTTRGPLAPPAITSAAFDPVAGETTIRGTASGPPQAENGALVSVQIFASDAPGLFGFGDAQRFLAQTGAGNFEVRVKGDLRGQWVAATTVLSDSYIDESDPPRRTTELGIAIEVR